MGTYIKGMKTPKACGLCPFRYINMSGYLICEMLHKQINLSKFNERFKDCPLVEVKEPHGRLIDADEIEMPCLETTADQKWMEIAIKSTPTIIEAEGREE